MDNKILATQPDGESTFCYSNRLFDVTELCAYLNLGRNTAVSYARKHGAEKRIGRRCLYDRKVIDKALDEATE